MDWGRRGLNGWLRSVPTSGSDLGCKGDEVMYLGSEEVALELLVGGIRECFKIGGCGRKRSA